MNSAFMQKSICFRWVVSCFLVLAVFVPSSFAVDPDPVDGADVEQIRTDVHAIRSSASALEGIGQSAVLGLSQLHDDQIDLYQFLDEYLSESGPEGSIGYEFSAMSQLLKQFLTGSVGDPWSSVYPQFRFLSGPVGRLNPADTGSQQSLTYFLNFALGQNIDYRPGESARSRWEDLFTTNSVFRSVTSSTSSEKIGYSAFNIWLAEAQRRQIESLRFATETNSFALLNPGTNIIQASASLSDPSVVDQRNAAFSNAVYSIDAQLASATNGVKSDMQQEQTLTESQYNNEDGLSSLSIGSDDGEVSFSPTIRIASQGTIQTIATLSNISPSGLTAVEWSPSNSPDVANGILSLNSVMSDVWAWVRNLAILAVGIYWWRRCRSFVFQVGNRNRA